MKPPTRTRLPLAAFFLFATGPWLLSTSGALQAQTPDSESTSIKKAASETQAVDTAAETKDAADQQMPPTDWASKVLASDPLAGKEVVTLEDLQAALKDERQRKWLIQRHFARAALAPEQQLQFLREALQHPDSVVREQAALELQQLGQLRNVVRQMLIQWIDGKDQEAAEAAIVGLQHLSIPKEEVDQTLIDSLLAALASDSDTVAEAAARQLQRLGPAAVPGLLEAMRDSEQPRLKAAAVLSRIVGDIPTAESDQEEADSKIQKAIAPPDEVRIKSAPRGEASAMLERNVDEEDAEIVRVYYGTNREISQRPVNPRRTLAIWGVVFAVTLVLSLWRFAKSWQKTSSRSGFVLRRLFIALCLIGLMVWSAMQSNAAIRMLTSARAGVRFGGHRSADSTIYYGYCDVSIPPTHSLGEVERPLIGPEDENKHVVLREVALVDESAFYDAINRVLEGLGDTSRDCLLYVHGYNVAFDDAAMRSAQIHHDLAFAGTSIFYSWPSRASVRHYFSDRNEIRFSHRMIKEFLEGILNNVDVDRFHVIAHSMGADALCQAILELDPEGQVFDQLILAAPDIDVDVFREQILPQLQQCGTRTTLYCSKNDFALHASKHFNDSLRAGDSSNGPLVAGGLDTVDASDMDTELLGHSYYGNCLSLLDDLRLLIEQNRPPDQRQLEPLFDPQGIPYWIFIE